MGVVDLSIHNLVIFKHFQPVGQRVWGDPRQRRFEIRKSSWPVIDELANYLAGPA